MRKCYYKPLGTKTRGKGNKNLSGLSALMPWWSLECSYGRLGEQGHWMADHKYIDNDIV